MIYRLLTLLLSLASLQAAVLTDGILAASDTSGTNATVRSVTITGRTNLNAGTLTATNNATVGANLHVVGSTQIDTLQTRQLVVADGSSVLGSVSPGSNDGAILVSHGSGVAPSYDDNFLATSTNAALVGVLTANGGNFTNFLRVNGVDVLTTAGGSGFVKNTGTPAVGNVPTYTDTTGTNIAPSSALTITGTNAALTGVLTANGVNATNFLRLNGVDVMTTTSGSGFVKNTGASTANAISRYSDTTGTNIAPTLVTVTSSTNLNVTGRTTSGLETISVPVADTTALTVNGGSVTGSGTTTLIDLSGTWNTSGNATFAKFNVTNTASGASALIADFQASGVSQTSISKAGNVNALGLVSGAQFQSGSSGNIYWQSRSVMSSPADGQMFINNQAGTAGADLRFRNRATPSAAPTIASAGTIAPTAPITFISGTTTIDTITAPSLVSSTGGQITLIPTGIWSTSTSGNVALATVAVVSKALILTYDQATAKWYPSY